MSRAIRRPRRGWGRKTFADHVADAITGGLMWCVVICILSVVAISIWASAIKAVEDVVGYYENFETQEDYDARREAEFKAELSDTHIQQAPKRP